MNRQRMLLLALPPLSVIILSFALWFLSSSSHYSFDTSLSSATPSTLALAFISLLISAITILFARRFLPAPERLPSVPFRVAGSGGFTRAPIPLAEFLSPALTENIIILGLVAAVLSRNAAAYLPFLAIWMITFAYVARLMLSLPRAGNLPRRERPGTI